MPELPEVETVRRTLAPAIGMRVTEVWTSGMPLRLNQPVERERLQETAVGRFIENIRRRGKYLLIDVAGGERSILVHLGMSGRLRMMEPAVARPAHTHVVFVLSNRGKPGKASKKGKTGKPGRPGRPGRTMELRYSDPRRFGQVTWVRRGAESEHPALARLGLDPLLDELTGAYLYEYAHRSSRTLKSLLLDQSVIAGVGNIYASEALWQARLRPTMRASRLSKKRAGELARAVQQVLERALGNGGTTLRDFVNADGREGNHGHYLWVYDREGQPCMRKECGQAIRRALLQGRATYYCPACQRR